MWFARALIFSLSLMPSAASATIVVGPPQTTRDEVVEDRAPGFGRLPAHALDRQQYLLSVCAHADDNQERNRRGFAVEADPHHGAIKDQPHDRLVGKRAGVPGFPVGLHFAPDPAHCVLAHRAAE